MHAFSGAILGTGHDAALPTVAQIDGTSLILFSSEGPVGRWPLDQVQVVEAGDGHFEVMAEDRRLFLVVDQPRAFEQALEAARAGGAQLAVVVLDTPEEDLVPKGPGRHRLGHQVLFRRPRHGRASVRTLPFVLAMAAIVGFGYLAGSFVGELIHGFTTEGPEAPRIPAAEVTLRTFQGSGHEVTSPFTVRAPWEIRWSFQASGGARLEVIAHIEDGAGGTVAFDARPGSGAVPLTESGTFHLEIESPPRGEWSVSVVQVANADAG